MSDVGTSVDHETVYNLLLGERWSELLDVVRRRRETIDDDPLLAHAVDVFVTTFFRQLESANPVVLQAELETLFLLHTGRYYRLDEDRFESVVERLVALHADRPAAALGYARHCPDNATCRDVLDRHDLRREVEHERDEQIRIEKVRARDDVDFTVGLFRSKQEEAFFLAVREVFASYFAYPNVALSSLLDFERIRDELTPSERQFFFRGVVDCVVFDQQDGYRPRYFFELDSPYHDADRQRENDAMKDRILSVAGQTLLRIRPAVGSARRSAFVRLLNELVRP